MADGVKLPSANAIGAETAEAAIESVDELPRCAKFYPMKFICQVAERDGLWTAEHAGPDIGPIHVTAPTREAALRKMEEEIHYWLELCPCSGQTYRDLVIELVEPASQ